MRYHYYMTNTTLSLNVNDPDFVINNMLMFSAIAAGRAEAPKMVAHGKPLYSPTTGLLVGVNIGTTVRPEVVPVDPVTGAETVAQFLARGGKVKTCRPSIVGMNTTKMHVKGAGANRIANRMGASVRVR